MAAMVSVGDGNDVGLDMQQDRKGGGEPATVDERVAILRSDVSAMSFSKRSGSAIRKASSGPFRRDSASVACSGCRRRHLASREGPKKPIRPLRAQEGSLLQE